MQIPDRTFQLIGDVYELIGDVYEWIGALSWFFLAMSLFMSLSSSRERHGGVHIHWLELTARACMIGPRVNLFSYHSTCERAASDVLLFLHLHWDMFPAVYCFPCA